MKKILIVEDEIFISEMYAKVFADNGWGVDTALDGETAITKATTTHFDMILLDIMLPKVTGIDVLKKLREILSASKESPVYMITNLGQEDIMNEAFKLGAVGYIVKSQLTPKDIVQEINSFFEKQARKDAVS